jgi:hypothetical protein
LTSLYREAFVIKGSEFTLRQSGGGKISPFAITEPLIELESIQLITSSD